MVRSLKKNYVKEKIYVTRTHFLETTDTFVKLAMLHFMEMYKERNLFH